MTRAFQNREGDDRLLELVELRAGGLEVHQIASMTGLRQQYISTATNRVMRADLEESGEAAADVRKHYWKLPKRGAVKDALT